MRNIIIVEHQQEIGRWFFVVRRAIRQALQGAPGCTGTAAPDHEVRPEAGRALRAVLEAMEIYRRIPRYRSISELLERAA